MNKELYPVAHIQAKPMDLLDDVLLRGTHSAKDAVRQMVSSANTTQDAIANEMGVTQYSISRFINGNRGMNIDELESLINACGNLYLVQYLAYKYGMKLVKETESEQEIKALEYQLMKARRSA